MQGAIKGILLRGFIKRLGRKFSLSVRHVSPATFAGFIFGRDIERFAHFSAIRIVLNFFNETS